MAAPQPICILAHAAWIGSSLNGYRQYRAALHDPARAQREMLMRCLRLNADTRFGRQMGFAGIRDVGDYQRRVPLSRHEDYVPFIDQIKSGESAILTCQQVRRLVPTSGSTQARKLIPYTDDLHREFNRAIGAWITDIYLRHPSLAGGPAYWSISPAGCFTPDGESAVPIGFDDDTAYLGGIARRIVARTLAVPAAVRMIDDLESFRYVTLASLLRARQLRLISVWHPSFLTLLLEPLQRHWNSLLRDISDGTLSPPTRLPVHVNAQLSTHLRPDPTQARRLGALHPADADAIWPRLRLISCWGDGASSNCLDLIRKQFPHARIQRKGLIATEGIVTIPWGDAHPLAVRSHFFEFVTDNDTVLLAHELREGEEYSVVLTTGGGLYRYRLRDRVRVTGFCSRTPSLTFIGKDDGVADRCGEKLSQGFVAQILDRVCAHHRLAPAFKLLAPERSDLGWQYVLYVDQCDTPPAAIAESLETALSENPHYRYCVTLGQLKPAAVKRTAPGALRRYVEEMCRRGQRVGEIKLSPLAITSGWSKIFECKSMCEEV